MDLIETIILGLVQGVTELLPISSSGHLLLISDLVFNKDISTFLLTSLHLGTTIAILISFRGFFYENLFKKFNIKPFLYIGIATVPAALFGTLLKDLIEDVLRGNIIIVAMLIFIGFVMILVENSKWIKNRASVKRIEDITLFQAILMGIGQSLALIPGTSRSGSTTITGMLLGIEKFKALEYSFILGIPVMLGSFAFELISQDGSFQSLTTPTTLVGILISALTGFLAIEILKSFSKKNFLTFFGVYRVLLGVILLLLIK